MSTYILTGNYTTDAIKGMLAHPSDREAAVKPLVEASGGKIIHFYATMGPHDFLIIMEGDDIEGVISSLMVAGATGTVSNLCTVQAFDSAAFLSAQKRASKMASAFTPANA